MFGRIEVLFSGLDYGFVVEDPDFEKICGLRGKRR
jgi:hypothetical protein